MRITLAYVVAAVVGMGAARAAAQPAEVPEPPAAATPPERPPPPAAPPVATPPNDNAPPAAATAPPESAPPEATAPPVATAPPPDVVAGERSDGRLDPPPKRRWRLLPEVLLFPFRAIFWGISYPVGAALRTEDRIHPMHRVFDLFTWSGGTRGIRPAFYYSTINIPEFGLKYFDHASLGVDTRLDVTTTVGGANYVYSDLVVEPTRMSAPFGVIVDVSFDRRGDLLYTGFGNHTYSDAPNGRYLMNALDMHLILRMRPVRGLSFFTSFTTGLKRFDNGDRVGSVAGIIYAFDTTAIPGFTHGTTFVRAGAGFDLDTRDSPVRAAAGLVLHGAFDYSHGIDGDQADYERLAAMLGVPINLWSRTHVLWLAATTSLAWQNGTVPIPFSELPTLGGPNDLRGFRFQDFRDQTAFFVTAEYRWPVWMWVDGALFFDYGGVFGRNYEGFGARRMQPDVGVALRMVTAGNFFIRLQLGYGFGEGFNFSIAGNAP